MVKPSEISRPITYELTGTVAKLLERPPCIPEVVCLICCQVIPKNLNMILVELLFPLAISIEQREMDLFKCLAKNCKELWFRNTLDKYS